MSRDTLTFACPPDLRALAQDYANRYGITLGSAVKILIRRGYESDPPPDR